MLSRKLTDAEPDLVGAYVTTRDEYESENPGHVLEVDCTARSPEEQFELYKKGRKQRTDGSWIVETRGAVLTNIDGKLKKSNHNYSPSRALDFRIVICGKVSWDIYEYLKVGEVAQKHGLVWGGTWGAPATREELDKRIKARRFVDGPHLELKS